MFKYITSYSLLFLNLILLIGCNSSGEGGSNSLPTPLLKVTLNSPPAINISNISSYGLSGACSENGREVILTIGGLTPSPQPTCAGGIWTLTSFNVSSLADGSIAITVDHNDANGNNATQATANVIKDIIAPTVSLTSALNNINTNNVSSYGLSGACSENGRKVILTIGGLTPSPQPTCAGGIWTLTSFNVSSLADGSIAITVDHNDANGNNATQITANVIKDIIAPTVSLTSTPNNISTNNASSYGLNGNCSENGREVILTIGGLTPSPQPTCAGGIWTLTGFNVSSLADGSIAITVNHNDLANNPATQATANVTKDATPPTVSLTSTPANINTNNASSYGLSGACSEDGRNVTIAISSLSTSAICNGTSWTLTGFDLSSLTDNASIAITVGHNDVANNPATQATANITKDTVAPTISLTSSSTINISNASSYTLTGTCSENTREVTISIDGQAPSTQPTCTGGSWSLGNSNFNTLTDGTIAITVNHNDLVNNPATLVTANIIKDTVAPTVSLTSTPANINTNNVSSYGLSGACSENGREVILTIGSLSTSAICNGTSWTLTGFDVSSLTDNPSIAITVNHNDLANNPATQVTANVTKDATPPTLTLTSSSTINISNISSYTLTGTCSENTREVTISIDGQAPSTQPTCTGGSWSLGNSNFNTLTDGTIVITVDHNDANGNNTKITASVIKDTIAPTVSLTSTPNNISTNNASSYGLSGACSEDGRNVIITIGSLSASAICNGTSWALTDLDVSSLTDNPSIAITVNHNDLANNPATQVTANIAKDATNPTVSITSAPAIDPNNRFGYALNGACSENGQNVIVTIGTLAARTATCSTQTWSLSAINAAGLSDGTISITLSHTDSFSNNTLVTTSVEKASPTVRINALSTITTATAAAHPVTGTCSEVGREVRVSIDGGVSPTTQPICQAGNTWSASADMTAVYQTAIVAVRADHSTASGANALQDLATVTNQFICPAGYVGVPPLTGYTTSSFCVMKFETKNVSGDPTSQATVTPWTGIDQPTSITECQSLNTGSETKYDLITNDQWQTIVRNIELQAANWKGGTVGQQCLFQGNNSVTGAISCGYNSTSDLDFGAETARNVRARHTLSNGAEIWDLAGNVSEWVKDTNSEDYLADDDFNNDTYVSTIGATRGPTASLAGGTTTTSRYMKGHFGPSGDYTSFTSSPYAGLGQIGLILVVRNGISRGGFHNGGVTTGLFGAWLGFTTSHTSTVLGFRCTYDP